jgi:hypothetical protein
MGEVLRVGVIRGGGVITNVFFVLFFLLSDGYFFFLSFPFKLLDFGVIPRIYET